MCLAVPLRVVSLDDAGRAEAELGGVRQTVHVALLDEVRVGDYVIVHAGFAIGRLDPEEAERTLALFAGLAAAAEAADERSP
ncbi:MAG: HypC/HybG/HupF family hydrogenase formation chaperone [Deltaproteobacteria bacterium]|nr:HypC/HybG/HupF family hydrogenase formation chaperone [Deltaproteobacteria bacterium]